MYQINKTLSRATRGGEDSSQGERLKTSVSGASTERVYGRSGCAKARKIKGHGRNVKVFKNILLNCAKNEFGVKKLSDMGIRMASEW